jgi:hypothetical protein
MLLHEALHRPAQAQGVKREDQQRRLAGVSDGFSLMEKRKAGTGDLTNDEFHELAWKNKCSGCDALHGVRKVHDIRSSQRVRLRNRTGHIF